MQNKWLKIFGPIVNDPNILHFNRRSVSAGTFAGVFAAFMPLPIQMFLAISISLVTRGNIAVAAAATWISNPLTYLPLYYFCYLVGTFFLGEPLGSNGLPVEFELSTLIENIWTLGKPLLLGCVIIGISLGFASSIIVHYLWRWYIIKSWDIRRTKRKENKKRGQL